MTTPSNAALFIGRFQPFHTGHLSVIRDIIEDKHFDSLIIGIGSSQYHHTKDNPWTVEQRKKMITTILDQHFSNFKISVIAIPDIHQDQEWVAHVSHLLEKEGLHYSAIFTGNKHVRELFEIAGKKVYPVPTVISITGTQLRDMIIHHDEQWKKYVDPRIHNMIIPYPL